MHYEVSVLQCILSSVSCPCATDVQTAVCMLHVTAVKAAASSPTTSY